MRVRQVTDFIRDQGVDLHFCLAPVQCIRSRVSGNLLQRRWPNRCSVLNGGKPYRGAFSERALQRVRRHAVDKFPHAPISRLLNLSTTDGHVSGRMINEVRALQRQHGFDFVVCNYSVLSKLLIAFQPRTRKVIDLHDRLVDRNRRLTEFGLLSNWLTVSEAQEKKYLNRADDILVIQEEERAFYQRLMCGEKPTIRLVDIIRGPHGDLTVPSGTREIGFLGSDNTHNKTGLKVFLEQQWKHIRQRCPDALMKVAGHHFDYLPKYENAGVQYVGRVDSLADFYRRCDLIVNPCPSGSGLKIKSVEALEFSRPLVTTPVGAEGLSRMVGAGMFVEKLEGPGFADRCCELLDSMDKLRRSVEEMRAALSEMAAASRSNLAAAIGI